MAKRDSLLRLLLLLLVTFFSDADAVSERELDAALSTLRSRGYVLFGNAMTISNVRFELLRRPNGSYTLFAPTDDSLFALDMALPAVSFIRSIRRQVAIRRLPLRTLRVLPLGFPLPTLLSGRPLRISRRRNGGHVTVDGVEIVLPGLFQGRDLVAHGLAGILTHRRDPDLSFSSDPMPSSPEPASTPAVISTDLPVLEAPGVSPATRIVFPPNTAPSPLNWPFPPAAIEPENHGAPSSKVDLGGNPGISVPVGGFPPSPSLGPSPAGIDVSWSGDGGRSMAEKMKCAVAAVAEAFYHVSERGEALGGGDGDSCLSLLNRRP